MYIGNYSTQLFMKHLKFDDFQRWQKKPQFDVPEYQNIQLGSFHYD